MEEEKAAAYYNELLGKGRNAALFKQGLGFGGDTTNAPAAKHGMITFVGAGKSVADAGHKPAELDSLERDEKDNKDRSKNRHRSRSREPRGSPPRDARRRSRSRSQARRNRRDRSGSRNRQDRHRSRSRSRDRSRRHRDRDRRSRSRSRSRDRRHRDRDRRSRSRSRSRDRIRRHHHRDWSRSRSRSREGDRQRRDASRDRSRSDRRQESSRSSPSRRQKRKMERDQDWAELIPGFDSMTPAEKVKAKMKLQLSQTVVKDAGKGVEEEWERFDFNKDAPLDDDAKQDYFGDGTGASTDTAHIDNLGGSHLFITEQAKREARLQAAHEAAIFGAPVVVEDKDIKRRSTRRERERSDSQRVGDGGYEDDIDPAAAEVSGVVSEQIIALQAGSSWQERIKKMRAAQAQDES